MKYDKEKLIDNFDRYILFSRKPESVDAKVSRYKTIDTICCCDEEERRRDARNLLVVVQHVDLSDTCNCDDCD